MLGFRNRRTDEGAVDHVEAVALRTPQVSICVPYKVRAEIELDVVYFEGS